MMNRHKALIAAMVLVTPLVFVLAGNGKKCVDQKVPSEVVGEDGGYPCEESPTCGEGNCNEYRYGSAKCGRCVDTGNPNDNCVDSNTPWTVWRDSRRGQCQVAEPYSDQCKCLPPPGEPNPPWGSRTNITCTCTP